MPPKPLSIPINCNMSAQPACPQPPRWHWMWRFWLSVSAAITAPTKAPAASSAPQKSACQMDVHPGWSMVSDKGHEHPRCCGARGWWQPDGKTSQGINTRASFPPLAALYSSDLQGTGLFSVAGGMSGLHINYPMNVALFSVHESFMAWARFWQMHAFSVRLLGILWRVLSWQQCPGCSFGFSIHVACRQVNLVVSFWPRSLHDWAAQIQV